MKQLLFFTLTIFALILSGCQRGEAKNNAPESKGKCPFGFTSEGPSGGLNVSNDAKTNRDWWPNELKLNIGF